MTITERSWWKDAIIYQVYPASFSDSNGDGMGDLRGIIQRLDYIRSTGVNTIWVCPMYDSPQLDMGYDISDYESVYPPYGTVQDMEDLVHAAHERGLRVILDLVVNHTSDQHAWFKESRSSKSNPKRDWYIWRPAKYNADGQRKPPNNWRSNFGGSAWQWDEQTQEYYLHLFCPEQPDLNWENEEARKAIYQSAMIYWLDKGVDGFRVDTVNMYSKPPGLPDAPVTEPESEYQFAGLTYCNGPHMNKYLSEMNAILSRYDAMTVGECPCTPDRSTVVGYVSAAQKRLSMVFQFDVVDVGQGKQTKYNTTPFNYTLQELKDAIARTQGLIEGTDAWTTSFVENHDQARSISRFGNDSPQWRERSGRMLALLFGSLSGTLYIYQGQEIGMINMPKEWSILDEYKDVESTNHYKQVAKESNNDPTELAKAHAALQHLARDHARTPMQWDASKNGGFTDESVTPWMRTNTSTAEINVAQQTASKTSVLAFWRKMCELRSSYRDILVDGIFELVEGTGNEVFALFKRGKRRSAFVVCNFSSTSSEMPRAEEMKSADLIASNVESDESTSLQPWEGRLYLIA